jgi:hypothetical protein
LKKNEKRWADLSLFNALLVEGKTEIEKATVYRKEIKEILTGDK